MSNRLKESPPRKVQRTRFLQTVSAVLWSFFGVRKSQHHCDDMQNLNPVHVIIVGLLAAAAFVLSLLVLVNCVVRAI